MEAPAMYVQSLRLENIKAFDDLCLDFVRPDVPSAHKFAGLNFFVGGNSSGKSTLLKCLAMALSGPSTASQQVISTAGWLRRGARRGVIELKVDWDPSKDAFKSQGRNPIEPFHAGLVFEADEPGGIATVKAKRYEAPNR